VTNYTNIHPIAHISIPVEYYIAPNRISGALYHKVTTYLEYGLTGKENVRANPKSAIFKLSINIDYKYYHFYL
jgi:hypothetical protein